MKSEQPPQSGASRETLVGSVERVTFHNEENGFAVLKIKAHGKRDLVPVVGHAASISAGEYIHAVGVWINDCVTTFETIEATPEKLKEVSGIGEFRANRIAAGGAAQKAVCDIMEFLHAHGVGTSRAARIFRSGRERLSRRRSAQRSKGVSSKVAVITSRQPRRTNRCQVRQLVQQAGAKIRK